MEFLSVEGPSFFLSGFKHEEEQMNWLFPIVIGTTAMIYIHSFNRIIKLYEKSERTLTLGHVLNIPVRE
jgi:hypothetical protein